MTLLGIEQSAKDAKDMEYYMIVEELHKIISNIKIIECNFNQTSEDDLVDYYILQLKAEQSRQSYLLKKLRSYSESARSQLEPLALKN